MLGRGFFYTLALCGRGSHPKQFTTSPFASTTLEGIDKRAAGPLIAGERGGHSLRPEPAGETGERGGEKIAHGATWDGTAAGQEKVCGSIIS